MFTPNDASDFHKRCSKSESLAAYDSVLIHLLFRKSLISFVFHRPIHGTPPASYPISNCSIPDSQTQQLSNLSCVEFE